MSQYDGEGLYEFLSQTPVKGLRQILIDKQNITDVHFNLLMKLVQGGNAESFVEHFEKQDLPRMKMGPAETKIKERFWGDCMKVLIERGLLQEKGPEKVKEAS